MKKSSGNGSRPQATGKGRDGAEATESAYTLMFEPELFRSIKVLAALRGQNLREWFRQVAQEEIGRAVARGELTRAQVGRPFSVPARR